ncbi:MAG: class I SAM-dependent methyltransferase [Candidatus Electrothrix sp. AR4]|nr:class I SAM-dependent methyltransferase [Candidatus Electrothrix sp. AR4]
MQKNKTDLLDEIAVYYSKKLAQYGKTSRGVDWNSEDSQTIRFEQLCKIITAPKAFSLNDIGCGYGALFDFLCKKHQVLSYLGVDISEDMIRAAVQHWQDNRQARFVLSKKPDRVADYGVASGIFNVRLRRTDAEWREYIETTLDMLNRTSRFGFAFNCLTSYSDKDKMHDYLYYADPCHLFDLCKRLYSKQVALLHDYGLYEFSILVRKV